MHDIPVIREPWGKTQRQYGLSTSFRRTIPELGKLCERSDPTDPPGSYRGA